MLSRIWSHVEVQGRTSINSVCVCVLMQYADHASVTGPVVSHARRWMLIVADCSTGEDDTLLHSSASVIICPKSKKPLTVICVNCVGRVWWWVCKCRWLVRLHRCVAGHRWRLTLGSSFVTNYGSKSNILLSVTNIIHSFFTITFHYAPKIKCGYPWKFSLPIEGLVNTSRTLGKCQIKMQRNFYIPKSWN